MILLSLDISAASTGWAIFNKLTNTFHYGKIKTKPKDSLGLRLCVFRENLESLIKLYSPDTVVIEDAFSGINVSTMKVLVKFAGVAEQLCTELLDTPPFIISNNTVKSYFKAKDKEELFNFLVSMLDFCEDWSYNKHNDITDAMAQAICFMDEVLHETSFREEKEYGFKYQVECHENKHLPTM